MTEKMTKEAALRKEIDTTLLISAKNPRGIPEIIFIVSPFNHNAVLSEPHFRHPSESGFCFPPCVQRQ